MKILVTGTEGYLGSLLPSLLMQRGHEVLGVDTGFYKVGWLYNGTHLTAKTLNKDIRDINPEDLEGVEAIVQWRNYLMIRLDNYLLPLLMILII